MAAERDHSVIEVYWRPGCGLCSAMRTALAQAGIDATWHNIWEDPEAASFVRSVAGGNETVPTVRIGQDAMVAPRARLVIDRLMEIDPDLVADPRRWPPLRVAQWVTVAVTLLVANAVARAGQGTLSLLIDGAAVVVYLGFRYLRSRRTGDPQSLWGAGQQTAR